MQSLPSITPNTSEVVSKNPTKATPKPGVATKKTSETTQKKPEAGLMRKSARNDWNVPKKVEATPKVSVATTKTSQATQKTSQSTIPDDSKDNYDVIDLTDEIDNDSSSDDMADDMLPPGVETNEWFDGDLVMDEA